MPKTAVKIGPLDQGRRMSLAEFDHAEVQEGYLYELGRGVIIVSDVPRPRHFAQVNAIRRQLAAYDLAHPGCIYGIAAGSECKLLLWDWESERHPDLSLYKTPPTAEGDEVWAVWVPEIVIEVISPGSEQRDYEDKREEYLDFGVREYWIFDIDERVLTVFRRWGRRWVRRAIREHEVYRTRLLPGFELNCALVFAAADAVGG